MMVTQPCTLRIRFLDHIPGKQLLNIEAWDDSRNELLAGIQVELSGLAKAALGAAVVPAQLTTAENLS
jgi:hypothetical protein